jgi:hypothetical protein
VEKTAKRFRSFAEAEKADRDFYKKLTGNERLRILVELLSHGPEQMIQLGRAPNRIDLLTTISGVTTAEAFATKLTAELDGIPVFVLGKDALVRNKRAVGRPQDLADLDVLES